MFAVYFVMHNQLCWPTKASYTVEMSGHDGPDSTYQGGGPTTVGGDISKSTQNLISAMEEVNTRRACLDLFMDTVLEETSLPVQDGS